jgi:phage terminase large subunit-like protein
MTEAGLDTAGLIYPALESPRSPLAAYSYGPLVANWTRRRLGIELGPWQKYAVNRVLEANSEGDLLARLALISVGRQNGKSVIVRAIVGWMLDEGYKLSAFKYWNFVLLAAHDAKQARIPYQFIMRDIEKYHEESGMELGGRWSPSLKRSMRKRVTMYTGIELNGITVDVATRQPGSARGVSPGLVCFDEVLTQTDFNMYEVLSPAQSAIPNSVMLMTSTAGFADSVLLRALHDRLDRQAAGAERHDPSFVGMWWRSSHDDVYGEDWDEIKLANPALDDGRLSRQMIENEFKILPHGSWMRERLNRWHDERVDAPFSLKAWGACRVREPLDPNQLGDVGQYTLAVDVTATWSEGSIIVAAQRMDGRIGVEVHSFLQSRPNYALKADDFVREIIEFSKRFRIDKVVYSVTSPLAAGMERMSVANSIPVEAVTGTRNMVACHDFAEAVMARRIAHDDPHLDSQIALAQRRFVGGDGSWRWAISTAAITSVVGATFATMFAAKPISPTQVWL